MNSSRKQKLNLVVVTVAVISVLGACSTNQSEQASDTASVSAELPKSPAPQLNCSAPAQVSDIWVLEPMLINQGKITPDMTQEQKEKIIRDYIRAKNEQYTQCKKGKF